MCTLCLSDMGELRDEWLRAPTPEPTPMRPRVFRPMPVAPRLAPSKAQHAPTGTPLLPAFGLA